MVQILCTLLRHIWSFILNVIEVRQLVCYIPQEGRTACLLCTPGRLETACLLCTSLR